MWRIIKDRWNVMANLWNGTWRFIVLSIWGLDLQKNIAGEILNFIITRLKELVR